MVKTKQTNAKKEVKSSNKAEPLTINLKNIADLMQLMKPMLINSLGIPKKINPPNTGLMLDNEIQPVEEQLFTEEEKFHLGLTNILCDYYCGDITSKEAMKRIMDLDIEYLKN